MRKFALTYKNGVTIYRDFIDFEDMVDTIKDELKAVHKIQPMDHEIVVNGKHLFKIKEDRSFIIAIVNRPKLRTFKIHMFVKYAGSTHTGLSTRRAIDFEDLIINRMNKGESKNWFSIWDDETGDTYDKSEWMELIGVEQY